MTELGIKYPLAHICRYRGPSSFHNFLAVPFFLLFDPYSSLKFLLFASTCLFTCFNTILMTESTCSYQITKRMDSGIPTSECMPQ